MGIQIVITPGGHLLTEEAAEGPLSISDSATIALRDAFSTSSAHGLLLLASHGVNEELPAAFVFWRGFARQFFQAVCQLGEGAFEKWKEIPAPSDSQLELLVVDAPPMRGLEYLIVRLLKRLWDELRELVVEQAFECADGPAGYLRTINPLWHLLGRVTFHLAENKRDESRPFAFLATFTNRLSGNARLQHVPLAEALKTYVSAQDREKLDSLLEPVRRAAEKSPLIRELLDNKTLFAPQAWTIKQAYRFLTESAEMEDAGVIVRLPNWWSARQPPRPQVNVKIGGSESSSLGVTSLLDFQIEIAIDGEPLTERERRELMAGTEGLALLRGKWVEVNREKLAQALDHWEGLANEHAGGIDFIQGMRLLAGAKLDSADIVDDQVASWSRITAGNWLRNTLDRLRDPSAVTNCQPGFDLNATLRPYQADGVRWLWFMTELGLGGCLADDMGLGKTIQVIDLLLQRKRQRAAVISADEPQPKKGEGSANGDMPSLLVVPASLIGNWRDELARFAPQLRVFIAHRSECDADTLNQISKDPQRILAGYDVVIATYSLIRQQNWVTQMEWSLAVLDEAQAIKNASSTQTKAVKKLSATGRIVLTGTPVENHLGDVWSLFDFCCPGLLGSAGEFKKFAKRLSQQQDATAFGALRRLVRPYILRRMKTDPTIVPDLPEKTEMRAECGLSKKQAVLYEKAVNDLAKRLKETDGIERKGLVLAMLMQFKQICNHPAQHLIGSAFTPADSGKFERLALLCEPIVERQEKVLVFTQFQSMTQPLADFLATVFGRKGLVLDGGTAIKKRAELVKTFQDEQGPPFFVISLKAGGTGLNLTAASHVVHFDRWWNPAIENQATDRAFRIGQKRNVLVHKFVCRGTIEERIDAMIRDKQAVADQLLGEDSAPLLTEMNDDELLRFVALDIGARRRIRRRERPFSQATLISRHWLVTAFTFVKNEMAIAIFIRSRRYVMSWYGDWPAYVPVAQRRAKAAKYAVSLAKKEKRTLAPVKIEGRKIAKSFWGMAWCENLERYSDYANRLPRGGTYARNGSVIDLQIGKGTIKAIVSGSEIYTITIKIETLPATVWTKIKKDCSQSIDSLLDLVQGKFDRGVMERLTQKEGGLFPQPKEIRLSCSCPDSAGMCKHIAATMYGVGHRLDSSPELLFQLRAVDHLELIGHAVTAENLDRTFTSSQNDVLAGSDLGDLFGIDLVESSPVSDSTTKASAKVTKTAKKAATKKSAKAGEKLSNSSDVSTVNDRLPARSPRKIPKAKPPATVKKSVTAASPTAQKSMTETVTAVASSKRRMTKGPRMTKSTTTTDVPRKVSRSRTAK